MDRFQPIEDPPEDQLAALKKVVRVSSAHSTYKLAYKRWEALSQSLAPALVRAVGSVQGRLAIGLGNASTREIGCKLHRTYGVPLIPGSSAKGVLRSSLEERYPEASSYLFGTTGNAGAARVHDAWWIPDQERSGLVLDVITPHHQEYYSGKTSPSDTESPIPVHFLTVTGKFLFVIECPAAEWSRFLYDALVDVGSSEGFGAKRAAGYGRFTGWRPLPVERT